MRSSTTRTRMFIRGIGCAPCCWAVLAHRHGRLRHRERSPGRTPRPTRSRRPSRRRATWRGTRRTLPARQARGKRPRDRQPARAASTTPRSSADAAALARGRSALSLRRPRAAAPRPAVAAAVRSRRLEVRRRQPPARRTRRLSPAGEARGAAALVGQPRRRRRAGARWLPHRLLRRNAAAVPKSRSTTPPARRAAQSPPTTRPSPRATTSCVGPLGRDEVSAVFRDAKPPVPMLALNRAHHRRRRRATPASRCRRRTTASPPPNTCARRDAKRVLVITGVDDGLHRAAAALRDALAERGGTVVERSTWAAMRHRRSRACKRPCRRQARSTRCSSPRARPKRAPVAPLLRAAGLGGKPRVATSHWSRAPASPPRTCVLDGIAYPTEPWTVRGVSGLPSAASVGVATQDRARTGGAPVRLRLRRLADHRVSRKARAGSERPGAGRDRHAAPGSGRQHPAHADVVDVQRRLAGAARGCARR